MKSAACAHEGCDCIEEEAPCGCKWYVDGTVYKCIAHRPFRFDLWPVTGRFETEPKR